MAASRLAFGGSNVMALVRDDQTSADAFVAMLASCPPVGQLHVQRGGGGAGGMELDAVVSCGQKRAYYPTFEGSAQGEDLGGEEDLGDDCNGAHNVEKKRRLSFDQVRSLERNFEVENKLEPERKMQLAKELGLQPRQVAVWFQNRRARWKTKQLERDYEVLTLDYNRLKTDYDAVMQEKQELQNEIESLTGKLQALPQTGPVEVPAGHEKAAPTNSRAKAAAPESQAPLAPASKAFFDQETVTVKSERTAGSVGKAPEDTSSDSVSSEIMDADSPRTMDSAPVLDKVGDVHPHVSSVCVGTASEIPVDSNIIHVSDHLCDQMLSPQACQRIAVKLEDGSFQDESSCNYILTQLDEERGLPWWDWP